jgi:hypothetical protein
VGNRSTYLADVTSGAVHGYSSSTHPPRPQTHHQTLPCFLVEQDFRGIDIGLQDEVVELGDEGGVYRNVVSAEEEDDVGDERDGSEGFGRDKLGEGGKLKRSVEETARTGQHPKATCRHFERDTARRTSFLPL